MKLSKPAWIAALLLSAACASDGDGGGNVTTDDMTTANTGSSTSTSDGSTATTTSMTTSTSTVDSTGDSTGDSTSTGPSMAESSSSTGGEPSSAILSAFHGLATMPPTVVAFCNPTAIGLVGMPVTFSAQLNADTVVPDSFSVRTPEGDDAIPVCATLQPADEELELRTVLLVGPFSTGEDPPLRVDVTGPVETLDGEVLQGAFTEDITPLGDGPSLVLAEPFAPDQQGLAGECPAMTSQVVQLAWQGGVTGPDGAALGEDQRTGVHVTLENGDVVEPIALADDDPDNYVHACIEQTSPAVSVAVDADLFYDPADDPNPATSAPVMPGA
ncbi:MAG: hypothetical protein AAGF11_52515 [Myxococcota bacterium]